MSRMSGTTGVGSGGIRVSEFHRLMAEKGMSPAAEIAKEQARWNTTTQPERRSEENDSGRNSLGFGGGAFASSRGGGMRGSRGDLFAKTLDTMSEEQKYTSVTETRNPSGGNRGHGSGYGSNNRDDSRNDYRNNYRDDSRNDSGHVRKVGKGTWKIEELSKSSVKEEPVIVKPKLSSKDEFPELAIEEKKAEVKSVWGNKKEVIETIKSSSMDEINDESKRRRKVEKYNEYMESQDEAMKQQMEKKKKDWVNRLKKQYAKDCNYRSIDDILKEEEQYVAPDEIDPNFYIEEQMLHETSSKQLRNEVVLEIDFDWYDSETNMLILSEWSREDNKDDIEKIERFVRRNDIIRIP